MNPFSLPGPQFLAFYVVLFGVMVGVALSVRWLLRQPADEPPPEALNVSPYEAAYLNGGEELTVNATIVRLVHDDAVELSSDDAKGGLFEFIWTAEKRPNRLKVRSPVLRRGASDLEEAVHTVTRSSTGETIAGVRLEAAPYVTPIKKRLEGLGLVLDAEGAATASTLPLILVLWVPLFGAIRIVTAIMNGRPAELLMLVSTLSAVFAIRVFGKSTAWRTRRGDRALAVLRTDNAAMEYQAGSRLDDLSGDDLVMAVGLFGMDILTGGRMAELQTALKPPRNSGGGCGGGCGGGGCGGGCGGCGG